MTITKGRDGWKAEDLFDFDGPMRLCVSTYKISGKLVSHASVNHYEEFGYSHAFAFGDGGDWSRRVIQTPGARCTEKSVGEQHARALLCVPQLLEEAKAHYVKFPVREGA